MAETTAIISSAGGIIAGTPFALGAATFVQQVTPPVVNTSRLVLLGGAWAGISAPGINAGAHSFVLGEDVEDSASGTQPVLIGYKLRMSDGGAASADFQVLVGNNIQLPLTAINAQYVVALGTKIVVNLAPGHATIGGNTLVGSVITVSATALIDPDNNVGVGSGVILTGGGHTAVGVSAQCIGVQAVAVGTSTLAGFQCTAVGGMANGGLVKAVAVGFGTHAGDNGTAVGFGATTNGSTDSVAVGQAANTNGAGSGRIALGSGALVTVDGTFGVGSVAVPVTVWRAHADAVTDLGIATTFRFKDLHLSGVVVQDGADGAAANAAAIVNAPTAKAFQWVPFTFNGASGWLLWQPA